LSKIFIEELGIREPDLYLEIPVGTVGSFYSHLFIEIEKELECNPPDAVVILGDTNSALAGIIAKRRGITVYHLEAGNRSFDPNVPEEINRKIVDHFADYNLPYTGFAKENLISEGLHPKNLSVIGSPLNEVLEKYRDKIEDSSILKKLELAPHEYFLVSAHRQENVDLPYRLEQLFESINWVATKFNLPVIVSTHPRTRDKLRELKTQMSKNVQFHEPFGFFDYNKLQINAKAVLSDSGSISEESAILRFPAITIRDSMERQEALEAGSIIMTGISTRGISEALEILFNLPRSTSIPAEYEVEDTSTRVVNFITSTIHTHRFRTGLRSV
jgi:UDP-N-acetylglucosamine 2-epimerase (non-hydrolysing)